MHNYLNLSIGLIDADSFDALPEPGKCFLVFRIVIESLEFIWEIPIDRGPKGRVFTFNTSGRSWVSHMGNVELAPASSRILVYA